MNKLARHGLVIFIEVNSGIEEFIIVVLESLNNTFISIFATSCFHDFQR